MFAYRGYQNIDYSQPTIIRAQTEAGGIVECKFFLEPKLNITILKQYLQEVNCQQIENVIIVGKQILPCNSSKTTRANENVEIFTVDELQLNVMEHVYQPKFEKVTNTEQLAPFQWSIMLQDDRVAKFMRYKRGDIIRITRDGALYYRIVL